MGGLLVAGMLVGLYFLRKELAESRRRRDAVPGTPQIARSRARTEGWAHHPRARRLGRAHTGAAGTLDALIEARRFAEASSMVPPEDHAARARLAVARDAPIVDLVLAARMEPADHRDAVAKSRDKAREALVRIYPGTPWGYHVKRTRPHPVPAAEQEAASLIAMGRLHTPLAMYGRLLRAFPRADAADEWRSQAALAAALLGRGAVARRYALELVETGRSARMRQRGSRLAQTVGKAGRTVTSKGARKLHENAQKTVYPSHRAWPVTPHAVVASFAGKRTVSERTLDAAVIMAALKAGGHVWVGHLGPEGWGHAVAVRSFAPTERVVLLSDGTVEEWSEFVRSSVWGDRMLVLHSRRATIPGQQPPRSYQDVPAPTGDDGELMVDPDSLAAMRRAVTDADSDPLASYVVAAALRRALEVGVYGLGIEDLRTHLAVSSARFPAFTWPLSMLAVRTAGDLPERARDMFAVGYEHWAGATYESHEGRADAFPEQRWLHLREANAAHLAVSPLIESMVDAARRRDGVDVDAHLELLQHVLPAGDDELVHCRALREVAWRGAAGALKALPSGPQDGAGRDLKRVLACQSGDPRALDWLKEADAGARYSLDGKFAALTAALHSGELSEVLAAAAKYGEIDGLDTRSLWSLTFALPVLAAQESAIAPAVEFLHGRSQTALGAWLLSERPDWGLELLRTGAAAGTDRTGAALDLALGLVETAGPAEREAFAREAVAALDAFPRGRYFSTLWDYARIAAVRMLDPERALADLRALDRLQRPLEAFVLCAAAATDVGDHELAAGMRARAANPALLNAAVATASRLGVRAELEAALAAADPVLSAQAAWAYYGVGGELEAPPPPPTAATPQIGSGALWRLAKERHFELLAAAVAHTYPPSEQLGTRDGAPRRALADLARGAGADLEEVRALLQISSHPAYLRAAQLALAWGVDSGMDQAELARRAPGLTSDEVPV